MRVLFDTHSFLWWIEDDPRLSSTVKEIIGDRNNELFFSAASGWEIAIKAKTGKLNISDIPEKFVMEQLAINAVTILPIQINHALHIYNLPNHHRDPFDRILIAQSQLENLPIMTVDAQIVRYSVETIW
jgi:PIN domain nuclease of toxin-antitoxin system